MATIVETVLQIRAETAALRRDLNQGRQMFEGTLRGMQTLARTLVPVLSIGGAAAFSNQLIQLGDRLNNLSRQTGLSIATLGGLRPVLQANGVSMEGFASGIFRAQRSLGDLDGQGKEAAEALKALGLNVDQLVNSSPDKFLEEFARALAKVENHNQRAALATRVLGRSASELIPTVLDLADNGIPKLNEGTAQAYENLAEVAKQMTHLKARVTDFAATALVAMAQFFGMIDRSPTQKLGQLESEFQRLGRTVQVFSTVTQGALDAMSTDRLRDLASQMRVPEARRALEEMIRIREEQAKIMAELNKPAAAQQNTFQNLLKSDNVKKEVDLVRGFLRGLEGDISRLEQRRIEIEVGGQAALAFGLDQQLEQFKQRLRDQKLPVPRDLEQNFQRLKDEILGAARALEIAEFQAKRFEEAVRMHDQDLAEIARAPEETFELIVKPQIDEQARIEMEGFIQTLGNLWDEADRAQGEAIANMERDTRRLGEVFVELRENLVLIEAESAVFGDGLEATRPKIDAVKNAIRQLLQLEVSGNLTEEQLERVKEKIGELKTELDKLEQVQGINAAIDSVGQSISRGIGEPLRGVRQGTQDFETGFRTMAANVLSSIAEMIFQLMVLKPILDGLKQSMSGMSFGGGGGGGVGSILGIVGGLIGGFFHEGGPVTRDGGSTFDVGRSMFPLPPTSNLELRTSNGLKPDEVAAILQLGELVLTKEHQRELNEQLSQQGLSLESVFPEFHQGGAVAPSARGSTFDVRRSTLMPKFHDGGRAERGGTSNLEPRTSNVVVEAGSGLGSGSAFPSGVGLRSAVGEVPAILQLGEAVLTKEQQKTVNERLALTGISLSDVIGSGERLALSAQRLALSPLPRLHDGGVIGGGAMDGFGSRVSGFGLEREESQAPQVDIDVIIRGSVTPERPGLTEKDVVNVVVKNIDKTDGPIRRAIRKDRDRSPSS